MPPVFLQRVADSTGTLAPAFRALKFGVGFTITPFPNDSLSGAQGGDGEVTGFDQVDLVVNAASAIWRPAVRAAIGSNVSTSSCSTTQDGLTLVAGDVVLLFAQTATAQNGAYVVGTVSGSAAPLTRVSWMSSSSDFTPGMRIPVTEGTNLGGAIFEFQTTGAVSVGTTALAFATAGGIAPIALALATVFAAASTPTPSTIAERDSSGVLKAVAFDSGANTDALVKRNGQTMLTLGSSLATLATALAFAANATATIQQAPWSSGGPFSSNATKVYAQAGQAQTGGANNVDGGDMHVGAGPAGTGGSGTAGRRGKLFFELDVPTGGTASSVASFHLEGLGQDILLVSQPSTSQTLLDSGSNHFRIASSSRVEISTLTTDGIVKAASNILSSGLLVDADVDGAAAIANTKISYGATINFPAGMLTPGLSQTANPGDIVDCVDFTITPQAAFASATGSHRRPGSFVVALEDSTNIGGVALNPAFSVTQGGRPCVLIGSRRDTVGSGYGALWMGALTPATATEANMLFGADGASVTFFNTPSGGTKYELFGGSTGFVASTLTASLFTQNVNATNYANGTTLQGGGTTAIIIGSSGHLGLFGAPAIAQPTRVGALSMSVGTYSSTLPDVGSSFNQTTLNNIVKSLGTQINSIESRLSQAASGVGLTA